MRSGTSFINNLDWLTISIYVILVFFGWLNIYSATSFSNEYGIFSLAAESGKQFMWFGISLIAVLIIFSIDYKFFNSFSFIIYGISILGLISAFFLARDIQGAKSWIEIGPVRFQPSEFSKYATSIMLAKFLDLKGNGKWDDLLSKKTYSRLFLQFKLPQPYSYLLFIIMFPAILIVLQHDAGSALVFTCFIIAFYREGLPHYIPIILIFIIILFILTLLPQIETSYILIGLAIALITGFFLVKKTLSKVVTFISIFIFSAVIIFSVDYVIKNVLEEHQQKRIQAFIDAESDRKGAGWNIIYSKRAIASGGFSGTGYLEGRYIQLNKVYAQSTDFIFSTLAEEHGWMGCMMVILIYVFFLIRIIILAERQKSLFTRVYGYCVVSLLFFHFAINIGMTMGLAPVIGIPLPFFSYGGSSLMSFTILVFTFLKLDAHRMDVL